jgi:Ser/Thr protein kinase RdoA (MazF antagonist)
MQPENLTPSEIIAVESLLDAFFSRRPAWRLIQYSEGIVIEGQSSESKYILKIIPGAVNLVTLQARLDWIRYLQKNQESASPFFTVPQILPSRQGRLIEQTTVESTCYSAYLYTKIPLAPESQIDWSDARLPEAAGAVIGRMHNLAVRYQGTYSLEQFGHILSAPWLAPGKSRHDSQQELIVRINQMRRQIERLPVSELIFGLVHDDLHTGNLFRQDDRLVILDFDCTVQHWFTADLASTLLFRVWIGPEKQTLVEEANEFLRGLLQGYQSQRSLPEGWAEMLPIFLKLRELSLYWSFFWDHPELDPGKADAGTFPRFVHESLLSDKPFLAIDYRKLA